MIKSSCKRKKKKKSHYRQLILTIQPITTHNAVNKLIKREKRQCRDEFTVTLTGNCTEM